MAADHKLDIHIATSADTAAAQQAAAELDKVAQAAEQATAQADETGRAVAQAAGGGETDADFSARLFAPLKAQLDEAKAKADALGDAGSKAGETTGAAMNKATLLAGGVTAVLGLGAAAVGRWISQNEDLSKSFDNAKTAAVGFMDEVLQQWLGDGGAIKSVLDGITTALGGQTEELRKLNEPLAGYKDEQELAAEAAKKWTDELEAQQRALAGVRDALEDQLTIQREQLKTEELVAEQRAGAEKAKIQGMDASDADKARWTAEVDKNLAKEKLEIRNKERRAGLDALATEERARANELRKTQEQLAAQEQRAKLAEKRDLETNRNDAMAQQFKTGERKEANPGDLEAWQHQQRRLQQAQAAAQGVGSVQDERTKAEALKKSVEQQQADLAKLQRQRTVAEEVAVQQQARDTMTTNQRLQGLDAEQAKRDGQPPPLPPDFQESPLPTLPGAAQTQPPVPPSMAPAAATPAAGAEDTGKATADLDATRAAAAELNKTKESAVALVADAFAKYAQTQAGELASVKDRLLAVEQSQSAGRLGLS